MKYEGMYQSSYVRWSGSSYSYQGQGDCTLGLKSGSPGYCSTFTVLAIIVLKEFEVIAPVQAV